MKLAYRSALPDDAAACVAGALLTTCFYEFCHCIEHLSYKPKNPILARMKQLHMAHHFHNEQGNYGITNFLWDRVFGTFKDGESEIVGQDDRRRLSIWEQWTFPLRPWLEKRKAAEG